MGASNNKVVFKLDYSKNLKEYFLTDTFFFEYDSKIDINNVDESILIIPILSTIIPIAWAVGADVYADKVDKTYLKSLIVTKDVFRNFYPQFSFSTDIHVKNIVSNEFGNEGAGLLFSGGIDSLTSYIRHKEKRPELISVWGADIPYYEKKFWKKVKMHIVNFANHEKLNIHFIKTNMKDINELLLTQKFKVKWWQEVSHGLNLLGLCAPLTTEKIGTIYIASSGRGTKDAVTLVDNNVSWADVKAVHDGYELSRMEKTKYIKKYPECLPYLRVCCSSTSNYNCGRCEKCLRTITALVLEEMDPENCDFKVEINRKLFQYLKDCLIKGRFHLGENQIFIWKDIQKHIPEQINQDMYGSKEFFEWFKEFDLSKYKMNRLRYFFWMISYFAAERTLAKKIKWVMRSIIARRL